MTINELRNYAEEPLRSSDNQTVRTQSTRDIAALISELENHHTELALQNEALRYAQVEIAEKKDQYADLYNNSPSGCVTTDRKGIILQSNSTFDQMVGVHNALLVGQALSAFVSHEDVDDFHRARRKAMKATATATTSCDLRFCTRLGKLLWVRLDCRFTDQHGGEYRFVIGDISSQKTAESRLRRLQNLQGIKNLAEGIAGELNQIMTVIFGNISMVRMKLAEDHPALKFLEKSEQSINRAERLSYQLLQIAREVEAKKERVDLARILRDSLHYNFKGHDLSFDLRISPDLWPARVDKKQIQKVFSNLITNAMQAMPEQDCLRVALSNSKVSANKIPGLDEGRYLRVTLSDGRTIDGLHDFGSLFDPTTDEMVIGKKIGMLTVYSIVSTHGGSISVEPAPDHGIRFSVYLPAE